MIRHVKCYQRDYPRPQFVRKRWQSLNGVWDFAFDWKNEGERAGWFRRFPAGQSIRVPFAYQTEASGVEEKRRCDAVWYRRTFEWDGKDELLLHFEAVDYVAKAWVNGVYLGSHTGGYTRFSFELAGAARAGTNELVVKAEDSYCCLQQRGKQRWKDESFECWYADTTGLWKTVWLEPVAETRLEDVSAFPDTARKSVTFRGRVRGCFPGAEVKAVVSYNGTVLAEIAQKLLEERFSFSVSFAEKTARFDIRRWSPDDPGLYDVEYTLSSGGKTLDTVGSYFGFADYRCERNVLLINDVCLYLKMVLDQGYYAAGGLTPATEEDIARDVALAKEIGFNGIRMHQKIEDERFYYYCDVLGMLVWCEMPSAYEFDALETPQRYLAEWTEAVKQYRGHPAILCWVPFNESWGVDQIATDRGERLFVESVCRVTKAMDGRPVVSNDGWEHAESDIITLHNYAQSPERLSAALSEPDRILCNKKPASLPYRLALCGAEEYRGQPVVVSEYAGVSFDTGRPEDWGYGDNVQTEEEYCRRIGLLTDVIRNTDYVTGYCITQLTDVYQETNGLLDMERKPKVPLEKLKRLFR